MKETLLAAKVVSWLDSQHWDIFQEVKIPHGVADIIGVLGSLDESIKTQKSNIKLWIIECKTGLSLTVIQQAWLRKPYANYVSIAVPDRNYKEQRLVTNVLNHLGIGQLMVSNNNDTILETISPTLQRRTSKIKLYDQQRTYCNAGSKSGYFTPYKQTIDNVYNYLITHGPATIADIVKGIDTHYKTTSTAKSSLLQALTQWESHRFTVDKTTWPWRYGIRD
mgnify:FL=1